MKQSLDQVAPPPASVLLNPEARWTTIKDGLWKRTLAGAIALAALGGIAPASAVQFTWNPAQANPPLSGAGSAFTADTIDVTTYLWAIHPPDGSFAIDQLLDINGFQLNGRPVTAPGFDSTYGLYFRINGSGQQIGAVTTYNTLNISLMADPGNNDGTVSATATGVSFSNTGPTGVADDFTLGAGTLISASLAFNPVTMVRNAHYLETFAPAPGETGFFGMISPVLDVPLTTPPAAFQTLPPGPDGTFIQLVNGGFGQAVFVPEPASMVLLASGLLGLGLARRRLRAPKARGGHPSGMPASFRPAK